ncbi:hypothetical protein TEA_013916 [Camellia sinensis var. sinensis]|uniref:Jacalin-type lectin domain-containing protein n=1 Tax=Camellia sinensis var. sinensis TaxID=542762 RepID=A0A4S4EF42_CAMSN|nr:hypothetical protein TEA_013916 [Camellia sinensis var. sinensis]
MIDIAVLNKIEGTLHSYMICTKSLKNVMEESFTTKTSRQEASYWQTEKSFKYHELGLAKEAKEKDRWLCAATAKKVEELEIYVGIKKRRCYSLPRIVLAAETLTSLKLYGCKLVNYNNINLPNLKQLSIKKVRIDMNIIQSFIRRCPWIEDLRLILCTGLDRLHVSTLIKLNRLEEAKFYFESMMEKDEKNKHAFEGHNINLLNKFLESLGKFNQSESLKLVVRHDKDVIVCEELRDIQLLPFYDLKLEIINSSTSLKDLLDSLLRTTRPENLSVVSPSNSEFLKEGEKDQAGGKKLSIVVGPWGGNGGNYWDDGSYSGVREITLAYDRCIDSIRVVYDKNGKPVAAEQHGGVGGTRTAEIKLQYPEEFLTSVSGHYCPVVYGGSPVIRSLTFKSNRRSYGPFGVEEGTPFSFSMDGGVMVGFKGRSGWYVDAIGFRLSRAQSTKLYQKVHRKLKKLMSTSSPSSAPKDGEEPVVLNEHERPLMLGRVWQKSCYPIDHLQEQPKKLRSSGDEEGTPFSFSMDGGVIVGFKGWSGWYLDAIAFRSSRLQTTKLYQKVQQKLKKLVS